MKRSNGWKIRNWKNRNNMLNENIWNQHSCLYMITWKIRQKPKTFFILKLWELSEAFLVPAPVFQGGQVLPYLFRDVPIEAHGDLYDTQIWKITPKDITLCFFLSLSLSYQKKKKKNCLLSVSLGVYATLFVKFHTSFFCDINVNSEFRRILNENSNLWQGS